MRQFAIGILCSAAFLAAACNKASDNNASADVNATGEVGNAVAEYYAIAAGDVTGDRAHGIKGSFSISQASGLDTGIESQRFGGACIAFPAEELGFSEMAKKHCNTNVECSNPYVGTPTNPNPPTPEDGAVYTPAGKPAHQEHRYGYCDQDSHKCWAKPIYAGGDLSKTNSAGADAALCVRRIKPLGQPAWDPDKVNEITVSPAALAGFGLKNGAVRARVVACLQGTNATKTTGCSSVNGSDRMEVLGKVANVTP